MEQSLGKIKMKPILLFKIKNIKLIGGIVADWGGDYFDRFA